MYAPNFVTIFGVIFKFELFNLKVHFPIWTSKVQFYSHLLMFYDEYTE